MSHTEQNLSYFYAKLKKDLPFDMVAGGSDTFYAGDTVRVYKGSLDDGGATLQNGAYTSPTGGKYLVETPPEGKSQFWLAYKPDAPGVNDLDSAAYKADTGYRQVRVGFAAYNPADADVVTGAAAASLDKRGLPTADVVAVDAARAGGGWLIALLAAAGAVFASRKKA